MTLPISEVDERDYDLVDITQYTNDGNVLTGKAVLCDLSGGLVHISFTHSRRDTHAHTYPDAQTPVSAIEWMERFGLDDLTTDANEALSEQRDWLRDLDVQGNIIGWTVRLT